MGTISKYMQNLENDIIEIVLGYGCFIAQKETLEIAVNECVFSFLQNGTTSIRLPIP